MKNSYFMKAKHLFMYTVIGIASIAVARALIKKLKKEDTRDGTFTKKKIKELYSQVEQ